MGIFLVLLEFFFLFSPKKAESAGGNSIIINEVMWMGTAASANDEWLELYNLTDKDIDLAGWVLEAEDGSPCINLSGIIPSQGYFLLERGDDQTVADIAADLVYSGALENGGERLFLKDSQGNIVDEIDASLGWPAGNNSSSSQRASMERKGDDWVTNDGMTVKGRDAYGNQIKGSPRALNSSGFLLPTATLAPTLMPTSILTLTPTMPTLMPLPSSLPTATPSPAKAIYYIKEVKDKDGQVLKSVKIYVDGQYVHHYAPEKLEFGGGCFCDEDQKVACGFGKHKIRLEKSGYQDWDDEKIIKEGDFYEVAPVMVKLPVPTATPIPSKAPSPSPLPSLLPSPSTPSMAVSSVSVSPEASSFLELPFSWPPPALTVYHPPDDRGEQHFSSQVLGEQTEKKEEEAISSSFFLGTGLFYLLFPFFRLKRGVL